MIDGATNALLAPIPVGPGVLGLAVDEATGTLSMAMFRRGVPNEFAALGTMVDDGVSEPRVLPRVDLGDPRTQPLDVAVDPSHAGSASPASAAAVSRRRSSCSIS